MNNIVKCPDCNGLVSKNAICCPHCGRKNKAKMRSKKGGFISLGMISFFWLIAGVGWELSPDGINAHPISVFGVIGIIACIVSAMICFTSPAK